MVKSLQISLNNVVISNESDVNRSSIINYILNNGKNDYADFRNLELNSSVGTDLTLKDNQFISKDI